jgi:hypothetical protein
VRISNCVILRGATSRPHPPTPGEPVPSVPPVEAPVLDSSARSFSQRLLGGRKLRFPPSNRRFAPCLPFADFVLRPKGPSPLEPPLLCLRKPANSLRTRRVIASPLWRRGDLMGSGLLRRKAPRNAPLRPRRTSSSNTLASSPGGHPSATEAFGRLAAPLLQIACFEVLPRNFFWPAAYISRKNIMLLSGCVIVKKGGQE